MTQHWTTEDGPFAPVLVKLRRLMAADDTPDDRVAVIELVRTVFDLVVDAQEALEHDELARKGGFAEAGEDLAQIRDDIRRKLDRLRSGSGAGGFSGEPDGG
ncbi:MAG: hypothetical protein JJ872_14225 [Marivivens sp.]|jgi:hypothetical protein|nr:hypothetical protein [Marivivens sp.]